MAAKRSKPKTPKRRPSGKGFTMTMETEEDHQNTVRVSKAQREKKPKVTQPMAQSGQAEVVKVLDHLDSTETEEEREFRERYLSAEKEIQPDWKQQMEAAKTKEDRFKVGLKVGDFKTSYSILFDEVLGSFAAGDKERLDSFLSKVGLPAWQLALIQLVVIGVPFAGVTHVMGLWK